MRIDLRSRIPTSQRLDVWASGEDQRTGGASPPASYVRTNTGLKCNGQPIPDHVYRDRNLSISGEGRRFFIYSPLTALPESAILYETTEGTAWEIVDSPDHWPNHWEVLVQRVSFMPDEITEHYA